MTVRLYRFFNFSADRYGEPFALCDKHRKTQNVPKGTTLIKIADKAVDPCSALPDADEDSQ